MTLRLISGTLLVLGLWWVAVAWSLGGRWHASAAMPLLPRVFGR